MDSLINVLTAFISDTNKTMDSVYRITALSLRSGPVYLCGDDEYIIFALSKLHLYQLCELFNLYCIGIMDWYTDIMQVNKLALKIAAVERVFEMAKYSFTPMGELADIAVSAECIERDDAPST
jgi:hypothetical protein